MERSCVVTGGTRGIGRAVVRRLLADGWHVVAFDLEPGDSPGDAGEQALTTVIGDATDEAAVEAAADAAERRAPLAGWVNNAAVFRDASVHTATTAEIRRLIAVNLDTAVVGSATAVRRFLAAGTAGAIVNLSSHQARQAVPGSLPYATAKAAIEGLTRALAVEYGPRGIRVNAVAPGSVVTERYLSYLDGVGPEAAAEVEATMRTLHPLGRVARAEEVAAVVAFLLGPDSAFVSGATLPVDGGRTVRAHDPEQTDLR